MSAKKLIVQAAVKFVSGLLLMGLLLFVPAGTLHFASAWRMLIIMFVPMLILGTFLFIKDRRLLEKRLSTDEKETEQKEVILISALVFIASFVLCGLDFRFDLFQLPAWLSVLGCVLFVLSYLGFAVVLRQNEFLSRTVEIQQGQRLVDTGVYGVVRHPMYSVILVMFLSMPLVIGSGAGLVPLLALPFILGKRIKNEEEVLEKGLAGYREYKTRVRWRLVPYIW